MNLNEHAPPKQQYPGGQEPLEARRDREPAVTPAVQQQPADATPRTDAHASMGDKLQPDLHAESLQRAQDEQTWQHGDQKGFGDDKVDRRQRGNLEHS